MTGWKIAAAELRIPWRSALAAHKMVIVVDPDGRPVRQINGLASWFDGSAGQWRHKPIGYLRSDRLRAYDTRTHPQTWLPINGASAGDRSVCDAIAAGDVVVMAGGEKGLDEPAVDALLAPAIAAAKRINGLSDGPDGGGGLPYPFLGLGANSNSVFATCIGAMNLPQPRFPRPARFAPGCGRCLLPDQEILAIRDRLAPIDALDS